MAKQSIKTITLKKILIGAFLVIVALLLLLAFNFRNLTIETMKDKGDTVANFIKSGLVTHMNVSTHEDKELYKQKIQNTSGVLGLNIIKSEYITTQFSFPQDKLLNDSAIKNVFEIKKPNYELVTKDGHDLLRVTFPYLAESECLKCHASVEKGVALGAVDFYIDVDNYKAMSFDYLYILITLMLVVLVVMLIAIFHIIDNHIKNPLDYLVRETKDSYEKHKDIDVGSFESLELEDVASKINLFNQKVIYKNMELEEKNKQLLAMNKEIEDTQIEILNRLGNVAETRSKETAYHVQRVAEYSYLLAKLYKLPDYLCDILKNGSPMHDIGKIGIPDNILNKPAKLTHEEFEVMKNHTIMGHDIFKNSTREMLKTASIIAYEHHEKWDGSGYPRGIEGEEIHIFGRITAIADVFDALGTTRCYKDAWEDERIFALFAEEKGKQFDPKLIDLFLENKEKFLEIRDRLKDINSLEK